jgi:eukaryotic-like serine/threonine-protein kinase
MSPAWNEVRAAFERALEVPPAQRADWLDQQLGRTGELRAAVGRLLQHDRLDQDDDFLQPPAAAAGPAPIAQGPGSRLGPFVLGELLGQGGMGVVHIAEQERPRRRVALKIMRGQLGDTRGRHRFEAEIEALARLQHPGIAQVHEAGIEADGTCWFAMELLDGAVPLGRSAQSGADLRERLVLFVRIVDAVQHAHQRGVIHRDLKPANILVLPDGTPKLIDFGIARVQQPDGQQRTEGGQLLGTLAYMSPEQVEGRAIDVRTDVYGLGAVLQELVTGQKPFALDDLSLAAACRTIVEREPVPPSSLVRDCPPELDWITARALRKEPAARYGSAAELAADVQRLLDDEPVLAAPPSRRYRLGKFVRRHRLAVSAVAIVVAVTFAALTTVSLALLRTREAERAEREGRVAVQLALQRTLAAEQAERQGRAVAESAGARASAAVEFLLDVFSSVDPGKDGREVRMADALARAARDLDSRLQNQAEIRGALAHTVGIAYFGLGLLGEAEKHLQASVGTLAALPAAQRDHARSLADLSLVQIRRGELDSAEQTLDAAAALLADVAEPGPLAASIGTRRADLLRARGDRKGARTLLEPLVADMTARQGAADRATLTASSLLAGVLHELGDLEAAEAIYRSTLTNLVTTKGEDHPDSLTALSNLMMVQYSRGERAAVLPTLQRLLEVRRRVVGEDHPDTIGTINNLAGIELGLGRYDDAVGHYRDAAARLLRREGEKHPAYAAILGNLATAERDAGQHAAGTEHADQALALRRANLGPKHPSTVMSFTLAADLRRASGDHATGLQMFEQCRELAAAAEPAQLANVYRCDLGIGRCAMQLGKFEQAEAALRRCQQTHAAADKASPVRGQLVTVEDDLELLRKLREKAAATGGK